MDRKSPVPQVDAAGAGTDADIGADKGKINPSVNLGAQDVLAETILPLQILFVSNRQLIILTYLTNHRLRKDGPPGLVYRR